MGQNASHGLVPIDPTVIRVAVGWHVVKIGQSRAPSHQVGDRDRPFVGGHVGKIFGDRIENLSFPRSANR